MRIRPKKGECKSCGQIKYIYSKGKCRYCYWKDKSYNKPRKKKKVNKVSDYHKETKRQYHKKRDKFLSERPFCEVRLEGCSHQSECVHHKAGKITRKLYLDDRYWMASCIHCNNKIEEIGQKAYDLGLKIKRSELKDYNF